MYYKNCYRSHLFAKLNKNRNNLKDPENTSLVSLKVTPSFFFQNQNEIKTEENNL